MMRFYNAAFMAAWGEFNRTLALLWVQEDGALEKVRAALADLTTEIAHEKFPVSHGTADHLRLMMMHLGDQPSQQTFTVLSVEARAVINGLIGDFAQHVFVRIPPSRKALYQQKEPLFGEAVSSRFPEAGDDISAAGRCLALDQFPAAVFHCMRVLEHGLRPMAARFGVSYEKSTWHGVLVEIERGLNSLRSKGGRTQQEEDDITNYSEAAMQFRHFKDAWRNHAAHGRGAYDEAKADAIYESVKALMQKMAEIA